MSSAARSDANAASASTPILPPAVLLAPSDPRAQRLAACHGLPVEWTPGVPGIPQNVWHCWLGQRYACWPLGVPPESRWSCVSSRLPRALDREADWFRRLRAACHAAARAGGTLVTVTGTAPAQFVLRLAQVEELACLEVDIEDDPRVTPAQWLEKVTARLAMVRRDHGPGSNQLTHGAFEPPRRRLLWLSPPLAPPATDWGTIPVRDRALVLLGEHLAVLKTRRGGQIEQLLARRSGEAHGERGAFWSDEDNESTVPRPVSTVAERPADDGASGHRALSSRSVEPHEEREEPAGSQTVRWIRPSAVPNWPTLAHCTRRHDGPWRGQSVDQWRDELIFERPGRDRSPLATLLHILREDRLSAQGKGLRGEVPMVCLTAVPVPQLPALRTYRVHRHRWDFEPYGIAICREWLERRGARPVTYGGDAEWQQLAVEERPWFQRRNSRRTRSGRSLDWTVEQEWRIRGDLDLTSLPATAAFVFVPDEAAAARVAESSRWPVLVLGGTAVPDTGACGAGRRSQE